MRIVLVATTAPLRRKRSRRSSWTGESKQEVDSREKRAVDPRKRVGKRTIESIIGTATLLPGPAGLLPRRLTCKSNPKGIPPARKVFLGPGKVFSSG
jgi:hypothetical protein